MKRLLSLIACLTLLLSGACSKLEVGSNLKSITSLTQFESLLDNSADPSRLLAGDNGIVLDFTATWCGPCQNFAPIFEATAAEFLGKVDFYKVDFDTNAELVEVFGVSVVPTLIFIPVSGQPTQIEGAPATQEEFASKIKELLL